MVTETNGAHPFSSVINDRKEINKIGTKHRSISLIHICYTRGLPCYILKYLYNKL